MTDAVGHSKSDAADGEFNFNQMKCGQPIHSITNKSTIPCNNAKPNTHIEFFSHEKSNESIQN